MPTCKVPWMTITLAANGGIKPCCVYEGGDWSIHNGDTLDSAWQDMDTIRQKLKGQLQTYLEAPREHAL